MTKFQPYILLLALIGILLFTKAAVYLACDALPRHFMRAIAQEVFEENLPPGTCLVFTDDGIVRWVRVEDLHELPAEDLLKEDKL